MRAMERLPALWDLVLIDCAPTLRYLSVAPLSIAQGILIPVEAHVLDLGGLSSIMLMTERVRGGLNPALQIDGILVCRSNRTTHNRLVVERIEATYPGRTFRTQIRESTRLAEAPGFQLPISRYAPGSTGDDDYRLAADELLERLAGPVEAAPVARRSRSVRSRVTETLRSRPRVPGRATAASPTDPSLGSPDQAD
jgi:chromosome partitioning protein